MASDSRKEQLQDHIDVIHGFAFKGEYFNDVGEGDILITPGNFNIGGGFRDQKFKYYSGPEAKDFFLQENDLIISMTDLSKAGDTLGAPALVPPKDGKRRFLHNQRIGKVVLKSEKIDKEYLYFVLRTDKFHSFILGSATGSTVRHTSPSRITEFEVSLPPLPIQRQIAAILSAFDDKIELNRRMNRTLEQMARALFKSWFVDFDPVRAKMRGEAPEGMDAETAALFPDELVEVEGREVPKGWEWRPFDAELIIFGGGTPKTSNPDFWDGEIPWYSVVDVPNDGDIWVMTTEKTITEAGLNGSSARLLPVGTTIISARGTVGKLALTAVPMAMNQSCYGLFPKNGNSVNYVYFATLAAVDELKRRTHGAVFDTITRDTLQSIRSTYPASELLAAFERECEQITKMVMNNVRESAQLAAIRDALLPRLLAGEIDVSEWEETQ